MIRLATTVLEQYRKLCECDYVTEESLIAQIKGTEVPSWQMSAGSAWHRALEHCSPDAMESNTKPPVARYGEFWFPIQAIEEGQAIVSHDRGAIREWKQTAEIAGVTLVAKLDCIVGDDIHDYKARFSPIGPFDYDHSLQWRAYLHVFGARSFTYHLFEFYKPDGGNFLKLHATHTFRYWKYATLREELEQWIRQFVAWAEDHGLTQYLEKGAVYA